MQNSGAMYVLLNTRGIDCQGNNSLRPKGFKKSADFLLFMFIFFEGCGMAMSRQKLLQEAWLGGCEGHKPQQRPNTQKRKSIESSKTKLPFFFIIQTRAWHGRGYRAVWKIMNPFPPTENITMSRTKNLKFAGHGISKGVEQKKKG